MAMGRSGEDVDIDSGVGICFIRASGPACLRTSSGGKPFETMYLQCPPPPYCRMDPSCFGRRDPPSMEKQERRTRLRLRGPSFKEREGKGSKWRSANWCRRLQTEKPTMASCHPPLPSPPRSGLKLIPYMRRCILDQRVYLARGSAQHVRSLLEPHRCMQVRATKSCALYCLHLQTFGTMTKPTVHFVTGNKNKLKEVQAILGDSIDVVSHKVPAL